MSSLGEKIWRLRERKGLSQEAFAEKVGVSRQTVSNWENGKATPDAYKLKQICEALSVRADDLLSDTEIPEGEKSESAAEPEKREEEISLAPPEGGKKGGKLPYQRAILFGIVTAFSVLLALGGVIGLCLSKGEEPPVVTSAFAFTDQFFYGAMIAVALVAFAVGVSLFLKRKK